MRAKLSKAAPRPAGLVLTMRIRVAPSPKEHSLLSYKLSTLDDINLTNPLPSVFPAGSCMYKFCTSCRRPWGQRPAIVRLALLQCWRRRLSGGLLGHTWRSVNFCWPSGVPCVRAAPLPPPSAPGWVARPQHCSTPGPQEPRFIEAMRGQLVALLPRPFCQVNIVQA